MPGDILTLYVNERNVTVHDSIGERALPSLQVEAKMANPSYDGKLIVTAESDFNVARIWDAATGTPRLTLRGHSAAVVSADIDRSNTLVITASCDGVARVWDVKTGQNLAEFVGPPKLASASFSDDGRFIILNAQDGRLTRYICDACGSVVSSGLILQ
jgi:WD40 repeat protein